MATNCKPWVGWIHVRDSIITVFPNEHFVLLATICDMKESMRLTKNKRRIT